MFFLGRKKRKEKSQMESLAILWFFKPRYQKMIYTSVITNKGAWVYFRKTLKAEKVTDMLLQFMFPFYFPTCSTHEKKKSSKQ